MILLLFSYAVEAQDPCAFISELEKILKTDPVKSAEEHLYTAEGHFLSVGNGFTSARPGFENSEEMVCVMNKHGFNMIWAGGDVIACENQKELGKAVEYYAKQYNQKVKAMLSAQGSYQCTL
ncbi:MAG: hypothetical protein ABW092_19685 [Candidatus Thiodiazotropha sp.]